MKLIPKFLLVLFAIYCFSNCGFAQESIYKQDCQKYYIQASDVRIANNGIFVNVEGDILCVNAIYVDDIGVYIAGWGTCRSCNRPNDDLGRCQNARCRNYGKS